MNIVKFILFSATIALAACGSTENRKAGTADIEKNSGTPDNPKPQKTGPKGTPEFAETLHDFGKITDGETVQNKFKFKNIGKGELTITKVQASCGCTTPEWTKEIIPPGGEGYVIATFNSSGKGDKNGPRVEKSITVEFDNSTIETMELRFASNIFTKDDDNKDK